MRSFFEKSFLLAHQNVKETARIAFFNADWRDFQSMPGEWVTKKIIRSADNCYPAQ